MPQHKIAITVPDRFWPAALVRLAPRIIQFTLDAEKTKTVQMVSLALSSDARVRVLNRDWRGKDKPTNVLSFPMHAKLPEGYVLGDIVLARQTLVREAKAEGKRLEHHFTHLLVHGVLHLLGYDHEKDADAKRMEAKEIKLLAQLGLSNPYAPAISIDKPKKAIKMRARYD
jgi:probable rRNA maturation factor